MEIKLTDDDRLKFKKAIRLGATYEIACDFVAISYSGFMDWIKTPEGKVFGEELRQVKRESIQKALDRIKNAATAGEKQAQEWLLKHCFKEFE